ncbi:hypothetical protein [Bacillus sp. UMB0893]|uniref:hypothetical protein n=1 Tax=Bacillus sp. UMB0893 TaxID=2066053 RepID=UPI0015DDA0C3|nr:hypothetical protein [Bacillus sp. UMB0893]
MIPIVAASLTGTMIGAPTAGRITLILIAGIISVLLSPYYYEYIEEDKPLW